MVENTDNKPHDYFGSIDPELPGDAIIEDRKDYSLVREEVGYVVREAQRITDQALFGHITLDMAQNQHELLRHAVPDFEDENNLIALGYKHVEVAEASDLESDYKKEGKVSSNEILLGRVEGKPIIAKRVISQEDEPLVSCRRIKDFSDELTALRIANMIDNKIPRAELYIVEGSPYMATRYIENSSDYDDRSPITQDRHNRLLLNILLGSTGDCSFQAVMTKDGTYVPVDLTSDFENSLTVDGIVDEIRNPNAAPKYGKIIKPGLLQRRRVISGMKEYANRMYELAQNGYNAEDLFEGYVGSEEQKIAAMAELRKRMLMMPQILNKMLENNLI